MAGGFESVVGSVREKIMNILGIHSALNQFNHDPGAALICENIVKAVCEEERFNRVKSSRGYFPLWSIRNVLKEGGLSIKDIDIIELNEAFASQSIACIKDLNIEEKKVNLDGGAIALGHPLGATGARITGKAAELLRRENKKYALSTQCIGLGQGIATVLETVN